MQILTQGGGFFAAENGVNSNVASPLCQNLRQKSAVFKIS